MGRTLGGTLGMLGWTLRLALAGGLALAFIAWSVMFFLPYFLSSYYLKHRLVRGLEQRTGKVVAVNGDFRIVPRPDRAVVLVRDVTIHNPPGAAYSGPLVRMKEMTAGIAWRPLLKGEVEVADISFEAPEIFYEVDAERGSNWRGAVSADGKRKPVDLAPLGFTRLRMSEARLHYRKAGKPAEVFDFDSFAIEPVVAHDDADAQPVLVTADLSWRETKFNLVGRFDRLKDLLSGEATRGKVDLASDVAQASFAGTIAPGRALAFEGDITAKAPSLRDLLAVFGREVPSAKGFGALSLAGRVKGDPGGFEFVSSRLRLDNIEMTARAGLSRNGQRRRLTGEIEAERINLADYLPDPPAGFVKPPVNTLPDLPAINIDLIPLKLIDADLALKFKRLDYPPAVLENGDLAAKLANGRLDLTLNSLAAYRGTASGTLVADGSGETPGLAAKLRLKDMLTGAILRDFANFDMLAGKGVIDIDLKGAGKTSDEVIASLAGSTKLALADGAFDGIDLNNFAGVKPENLPPGFAIPREDNPTRPGKPRTSYDRLSASFVFGSGSAVNDDLFITGRDFRVRAAGRLNLAERNLSYRVAPTLYTSSLNLTLPVRISGPFSNLRQEFDLYAFLNGGSSRTTRSPQPAPAATNDLAKAGALEKRGLKGEAEIEAYLAGRKIDPKATSESAPGVVPVAPAIPQPAPTAP